MVILQENTLIIHNVLHRWYRVTFKAIRPLYNPRAAGPLENVSVSSTDAILKIILYYTYDNFHNERVLSVQDDQYIVNYQRICISFTLLEYGIGSMRLS